MVAATRRSKHPTRGVVAVSADSQQSRGVSQEEEVDSSSSSEEEADSSDGDSEENEENKVEERACSEDGKASPTQEDVPQRRLLGKKPLVWKPLQMKKTNAGGLNTTHVVTEKKENRLTHLVPGYTAPMKLNSSYEPHTLETLRQNAERTDVSTAPFCASTTQSNDAQKGKKVIPPGASSATASTPYAFKKGVRPTKDLSAGDGWFGMQPTAMTDELKTDLALIRNRNYLDPKRFYKSTDKSFGKTLQRGTVIEGAAEFYSSRLTKRQTRSNLTEEIMGDPELSAYASRKYKSMQHESCKKGQGKGKRRKISHKGRKGY
jgi:hypothetical protein